MGCKRTRKPNKPFDDLEAKLLRLAVLVVFVDKKADWATKTKSFLTSLTSVLLLILTILALLWGHITRLFR